MRVLFFLFLFVFSFRLCALEVIDDAKTKIKLHQPAKRIITLAPDITEILFAIGAGDLIVGTVDTSDYPKAALAIPRIGRYNGLDLEKIISLHPDLIIVWQGTFVRQCQIFKAWQIPIYTTHPKKLEDVPHTMMNLGALVGIEGNAARAAKIYLDRLAVLQKKYKGLKPINVFYQIGSYGTMTINKESWIHQVIATCGGVNLFADMKTLAPVIGWEAIITSNPQVVISDARHPNWTDPWQRFKMVEAVKNQLFFHIHPDLLDRAGPRLVDGVDTLCADLQIARNRLNM